MIVNFGPETLCLLKTSLNDTLTRHNCHIVIYGGNSSIKDRTKQGKIILCNQIINQLLINSNYNKIVVLGSSDNNKNIDAANFTDPNVPFSFVSDDYEFVINNLLSELSANIKLKGEYAEFDHKTIVVLNDINKKHYKKESINKLLNNAKYYGITLIVLEERPLFTPEIRSQFDKIFIFEGQGTDNYANNIYEKHGAPFQYLNKFKVMFQYICKDDKYLLINNKEKIGSPDLFRWGQASSTVVKVIKPVIRTPIKVEPEIIPEIIPEIKSVIKPIEPIELINPVKLITINTTPSLVKQIEQRPKTGLVKYNSYVEAVTKEIKRELIRIPEEVDCEDSKIVGYSNAEIIKEYKQNEVDSMKIVDSPDNNELNKAVSWSDVIWNKLRTIF